MQAAHCALSVALKKFPIISELESARHHLETAINLSQAYQNTKYSIFWQTSPPQLKRKISQQMQELAFDCYSHMLLMVDAIDIYAARQDELQTPVIDGWQEFNFHIYLAFDWIEREHFQELQSKQLSLF